MRYQMFGCSLLLAAAVGCGGDDGNKVHVPDAKVFQDAPPVLIDAPPPCVTGATTMGGSIGSMMTPATFQTGPAPISKDTMSGTVFFGLGFYLDATKKTAMTIIVPRPANGFQTNSAYAYDPNPNATAPVALAFIEDGLDAQGMNPAHVLYASTGSVTFSQIAQTDGSNIFGSTTAANFREIDSNGADVAGGCTTMAGVFQFFLKQKTTVAFVPPSGTISNWAATRLERIQADQ